MSVKKRFIAGAVCPECQAEDTLAVYMQDGQEHVVCADCSFEMSERDAKLKEQQNQKHAQEQVIGVFNP